MNHRHSLLATDCPLPELDFDVITLGHGSGGALTNKLLDAGVFNLFDNKILQTKHDGAVFEINGRTAFSTDSFVVSPIFFPGGNIGELAVNGTVNDLAMCGADPTYLSLGLILEEGLKMEKLWEILVSTKVAAQRAGTMIVTGDTKVVEKGKGDKVFINTTGLGKVHPKAQIDINRIKPGDKVIVNGNLAAHGIAIMSVREGLEFESDIVSDTVNLNHTVRELLNEFGPAIHLLRDPTRGGVATVLNEIVEQSGYGIDIIQTQLPVDEQVNGACELLGLDPLYVANEGLFLSFVDEKKAEKYLNKLKTLPHGNHAVCIGQIVENHKQVVMHSAIGGKRVVTMLVGEQLPRIC